MSSISAGGIVRLSIGGVIYPVRGSVKVDITEVERTEGSNIDGSTYVTSKPVPPVLEATLSDTCGLSLKQLSDIRCQDVTVEMPEVGRTVVLIGAMSTGRPSLNPDNGEISGFKLVGATSREILEDCPC